MKKNLFYQRKQLANDKAARENKILTKLTKQLRRAGKCDRIHSDRRIVKDKRARS